MRGLLLLSWLLLSACYPDRTVEPARQARGGAPPTSTSSDRQGLAVARAPVAEPPTARALTDTSDFEELEVPGFSPAVVFAPTAPGPHPLIVAAHGAGGVPEWECEYWRHLSRGRAFLLCLRGAGLSKAEPSGYFYRTHITLGQEFRAAIKAFRERFSSAPRSAALYTGFSQGATMGAQMILEHGREFPYLALLEGGYDYWSRANAQRFGRLGGKRVLFVCGTQYCANKAKIPAAWLREANVEVRIEHALGAGHTPTGEVMTLTLSALPWLTAWEGVWE